MLDDDPDDSDLDSQSSESEEEMKVQLEEPPRGITGLALAELYFGPLLSPVAATPEQWTAYTEHRRSAYARYKNVFDRREQSIDHAVALLEHDLSLDNNALQKCISVMWCRIEYDEGEDDEPLDAEVYVRVFSLAAPKYVDVHIKYHCLPGVCNVDWFYSLGYKIHNGISGSPTEYRIPSKDDVPSTWHSRGGWQSICWGYYADGDSDDDEDNTYGHRWRRIEEGKVELHEEDVLAVHEALFGPHEPPPSNDTDAVLGYRRRLVATVRFLFAAVGIRCEVACTDDECDRNDEDFMLEGLEDKWVARGIRAACGFQLSDDPEAAMRGEEERILEAEIGDSDSEDDEWERSSEEYSW